MAKTPAKEKAVELKLAGHSLSEISLATGLSRPTIIKAIKHHMSLRPTEKKSGRPTLSEKWLTADTIQLLINSDSTYDSSELKSALEIHHKTLISSRSLSSLLKQAGWCEQILENNIAGKIQTHHDEVRNVFMLHAQVGMKHFLSFHETSPTDKKYLQLVKKLHAQFPSLRKIHSDITDLKYCPELADWQQRHIQVIAATTTNKEQKMFSNQSQPNIKPHMTDSLTHLERLEAESIHIMREVVAEVDNPVMLYSIGKDSAVMLHLALKAFYPAKPPFPLLHVDTLWKFQDMYRFRDEIAKKYGFNLIVHTNSNGLKQGINPCIHGSQLHTDIMKTEGLKQALNQYKFDAAFGGARRDEEKSRAKERIFSFRNSQHRWDPKNQRPELWNLYNTKKNKGESIRVFPLSNWTELDIWQYIYLENIPIVHLYLSKERPVVIRDGALIMVDDERLPLKEGEIPLIKKVRFRTLGCYPLTGAIESEADTLEKIIQEMLLTKTSERQGRMIDHDSNSSMEKKKQEGYF